MSQIRARSRAGAGMLIGAWMFGAGTAVALEPAGGSPEPETREVLEPEVPESEVVNSEGSDADQATAPEQRSWLRANETSGEAEGEESEQVASQTPTTLLALLLLAGLAGGAILVRLRRRVGPAVLERSPIRVVSSTKLGPKGSLLAVDVNGRILLLGVTEEHINELGWLDEDSEADDPRDYEDEDEFAPERAAGVPRGFKQVLGGFLGGSRGHEPRSNVPALLTESTEDVLKRRKVAPRAADTPLKRAAPRGAPLRSLNAGVSEERFARTERESEPARIEAQAAGIARRRR